MKNARNQSRSDAELLSRVSKEPEAFAEFYRRHVAVILAFVDRQIHDPHASFDITAEVFASALEAVGQFDPNRGSARNWLFGIARNATIDAQRAAQARDDVRRRLAMAPVELDDDGLERVEAAISAGESTLLALLESLPPDEKQALQARVIDERDYEEIGEGLGLSPSVIRKRVSRGLARMRPVALKEDQT